MGRCDNKDLFKRKGRLKPWQKRYKDRIRAKEMLGTALDTTGVQETKSRDVCSGSMSPESNSNRQEQESQRCEWFKQVWESSHSSSRTLYFEK